MTVYNGTSYCSNGNPNIYTLCTLFCPTIRRDVMMVVIGGNDGVCGDDDDDDPLGVFNGDIHLVFVKNYMLVCRYL